MTFTYFSQLTYRQVVQLGTWQKNRYRLGYLKERTSYHVRIQLGIMRRFQNTFAAGSLWTVDYALQLASVGYSAIHIHTRERGISYNVMTPPDGPVGSPGAWTTNPPFYAVLATAEPTPSPSSAPPSSSHSYPSSSSSSSSSPSPSPLWSLSLALGLGSAISRMCLRFTYQFHEKVRLPNR